MSAHRRSRIAVTALGALALLAGCGQVDELFCGTAGCEFTAEEWTRLQSLTGLPDQPPPDLSNKWAGVPAAEALGKKFYFDPRFSGTVTLVDMLRRPVQYARAPAGQPANISCATCHSPNRAGSDFTSIPGHVSVGVGWYDVNGQQTVNAAYYEGVIYWNARNDSLWSQILAVNESFVSMGSNRLNNFWQIMDKYRGEYSALFDTQYPLPTGPATTLTELTGLTSGNARGMCNPDFSGNCPTAQGCRLDAQNNCWPRFPRNGRPGNGTCNPSVAGEPFSDSFDCMDPADKTIVNRVFVNFAKVIAAYEFKLVSKGSPFDQFVAEGPTSTRISEAARRGARLFVGKASCIECHSGPLLSDKGLHNIGVPQAGAAVPTEADCPAGGVCDCVAGRNCLPWGGLDGLKKLAANPFRRDNLTWSDAPASVSPELQSWYALAARLAAAPMDDPELLHYKGTWRTPSLRDIAITGPYMHNGLFNTLEDVVWHYNVGGVTSGYPGHKDVRIAPLALTDGESADLVEFLRTLTGQPLPPELTSTPTLP